ncbi:LacI family DNA-binding transcriptional regulator [Aquipuribacter nitratireducens]|uniref:LacI family DNA-binding transcriptional regulator n=1 Tax=Aquipuribacter nitratireducens TaxID=650104 RepID=A0ABW0GUD3_9MICO
MTSIHDVARAAGVSISTVSYALSGKRAVTEATRRRVEAAVEQLGYRPNAGARMLAGRRTFILAVTEPVRPDTYAPAHMAFVAATAAAARRYDYDVLLLTRDEATGGLDRVTGSRLVDGVVVLDVTRDDERAELVRRLGVPAVVVGVPDDTNGLVCVDLDFEAAARLAVDRLVDAGHRVLGLLGHPGSTYERGSNFPPRIRDAFLAHAAARGVEARLATPERGEQHVRDAVDDLLGPAGDLTGLVMHCDEGAQRTALDQLAVRGVPAPERVSVVSAASTFDTSALPVPLDVIPLVPERSCDRAVELVMQQLDGTVAPTVELLAPTYVSHGSVRERGALDAAP